MEIPTVKSFCCMSLKTVGQVFGFFQIFIYSLAILVHLYFRGHLLLPIILTPIAVNICWIYGIREKKPMLMLPAMIPFVFFALVCICFVTIYSIAVPFVVPVYIPRHHVCTSYEEFQSGVYRSSQSCTSESYTDTKFAAKLLLCWIASCAISCVVVYLTIVLYSVYKSVEEDSKRNHLRLPTSDPNQNISSRA